MNPTLFFPTILMILDIAAALIYVFYGDWWRVLYWCAAAAITLSVVLMK